MSMIRLQPYEFSNHCRRHPFRELVESTVLLALAVLLFRSFVAEGYLISTGSMAPTLLGYHRRVECPACHLAFTRGAAFDKSEGSVSIASADFEAGLDAYASTKCPNCGLEHINARSAPRNEGDQLLVQKLTYEFRDPRRWEVVVFQNQDDPAQAYVKRVVGLPGESIRIQQGDVYANGHIERKPFAVQRALRVLVSDYFHLPEDQDPDWRQRWFTTSQSADWTLNRNTLSFRAASAGDAERRNWLLYEHWIRNGGDHETRIPLPRWPVGLKQPDDPRFRYEAGELVCVGALSAFEKRSWLQKSDDPQFHQAIEFLYEQSHVAPVVDAYGYNSWENRTLYEQHDLMLSVTLENLHGSGRVEAQLTDGAEVFAVVIDPAAQTIELLREGDEVSVWTQELSVNPQAEPLELDFSLFDQQVVVAVNGVPVHEPVPYDVPPARRALRRPVRIGASGVSFNVTSLKLFRDVYYTPREGHRQDGFVLDSDEFFVLGDNSPVSVDSRVWESPAVPRQALIGKPFVVHLPSRQGQIQWGGDLKYVRVPDFSRIRYIR